MKILLSLFILLTSYGVAYSTNCNAGENEAGHSHKETKVYQAELNLKILLTLLLMEWFVIFVLKLLKKFL